MFLLYCTVDLLYCVHCPHSTVSSTVCYRSMIIELYCTSDFIMDGYMYYVSSKKIHKWAEMRVVISIYIPTVCNVTGF